MRSSRALGAVVAACLLAGAACGDDKKSNVSAVPDPPEMSDGDRAMHAPDATIKPLDLPQPGTYTYDLTGTSTLGALPATATLQVEDIGGAKQRWTLQRPEKDGHASKDSVDLLADFDGLRIVSHRIERTTAAGPVVIDLLPADRPPLYVPYFKKPGQWSFDLASADGCYSARTEVFVRDVFVPVQVGPATFTGYHADLNQTVKHDPAKAGCAALDLVSEQQLWLDKESRLPVLESMKRQGAGATTEIKAAIKSTTPS